MPARSQRAPKRPPARRKQPPALDPRLEERIIRLFQRSAVDATRVDGELSGLAKQHGDAVYAALLYLLAHLDFTPREAKRQWQQILEQQRAMSARIGRSLDLRVALLDYFVSRNRKLKSPKILELEIYQLARKEAVSDELTGLFNFRYFETALDRELQRARRYDHPLSLLFVDLDDFKLYNDRNGHLAGNQVLRRVASVLRGSVRGVDIACRYGGEEFAVLLPNTRKQGAFLMAERFRQKIEATRFPFGAGQPGRRVTASLGIATYPMDAGSGSELVEHADAALYRAKGDGKNTTRLFQAENRSFTRVPASLLGSFSLVPREGVKIATRNLSKSGILFETTSEVPIGSSLDLRIRLPDRHEVRLRCQVVRVERLAQRRFDIGVRILRMNRPDRQRLEAHLEAIAGVEGDRTVRADRGRK